MVTLRWRQDRLGSLHCNFGLHRACVVVIYDCAERRSLISCTHSYKKLKITSQKLINLDSSTDGPSAWRSHSNTRFSALTINVCATGLTEMQLVPGESMMAGERNFRALLYLICEQVGVGQRIIPPKVPINSIKCVSSSRTCIH